MSDWVVCTSWDDLPMGTWLVKIGEKYHVAQVTKSASGVRLVVVGNHFSWDMGDVIAYYDFEKYTQQ